MIKYEGIYHRGYGVVPRVVMEDRELDVIAKAIYTYICICANGEGVAFPSRAKVSYDLNISEKTFSKHLSTLVDRGYLLVKQERGENGLFNRNVYYINVSTVGNLTVGRLTDYREVPTKNTINKNTINKNINTSHQQSATSDTENEINKVFDQLWNLYPRKEGKASVKLSKRKAIYKIGIEEMTRAINRYKEEVKDREKKYIKQGSSFFNTSYVDYLDANYDVSDDVPTTNDNRKDLI